MDTSKYRKTVEIKDKAGKLLGYVGQCYSIGWHAFTAEGVQLNKPGVGSFQYTVAIKEVRAVRS